MIAKIELYRKAVLVALVMLLQACDNKQSAPPIGESELPAQVADNGEANPGVSEHASPQTLNILVADRFEELSQETITLSKQLSASIESFLQSPSDTALESAQRIWTQTHDAYLLAATADFLEIRHPVLDLSQSEPSVIHPLRLRLDQYPILPGYLDSVAGYPNSGLVHSELKINFETLNAEHQFSDRAYVTLGFHALEFILNGDPGIDEPRHQDFLMVDGATKAEEKAILRRREYLTFLSDQLNRDLLLLAEAWSNPEGFYRSYVTVLQSADLLICSRAGT